MSWQDSILGCHRNVVGPTITQLTCVLTYSLYILISNLSDTTLMPPETSGSGFHGSRRVERDVAVYITGQKEGSFLLPKEPHFVITITHHERFVK